MCRCIFFGLTCSLLIVAETADAQIVRWGPGGGVSVRAPFVNVDVGPGGSTRVRAPFTSVNTPGFRRVAPRYEYPAGRAAAGRTSSLLRPLTEAEFNQRSATASTPAAATDPAEMNWRELRRHTRAVAGRLENELRRVSGGATWTASLRPGTIRDLVAQDVDQPPDRATVEQLAVILQSYDALADSNGYPQIARLSGFREMRETLVELTSPPVERARRNLAAQWTALDHDLGQFETGATWQAYLALPPEVIDGQEPQQLEEILSRYEQVVGPEEYRSVAELGSFRATLGQLTGYVELLRHDASARERLERRPEGIPAPRPMQ